MRPFWDCRGGDAETIKVLERYSPLSAKMERPKRFSEKEISIRAKRFNGTGKFKDSYRDRADCGGIFSLLRCLRWLPLQGELFRREWAEICI